MKNASLLFLFWLGVIATMYSQTQNEFVLEKLSSTSNTIQSACKEDGHRLATVEFFTAIKNVEFETVSNNRIVSKEYDEKRGSYILCLRGVDKDWRYIQIDISKNGFMSYQMEAIQIKNGEYMAYKLSPKYDDNKKKIYNAFVMGNYAYDIVSGTHSAGFSGGKLLFCKKRLGLFLSGSTTFPMETTFIGKCDKEGYLEDGSRPNYVDSQITQWSVLGGIYWRLFDKFYLKAGLGVGVRNVYWQTEDNYYYRNLGYSKTGLALTGGVQYHVNNLVLSLDMVTNSFRTADLKIGLGYSF